MLPDGTAIIGRGICPNHGIGDLMSGLIPKDCPECTWFSIVEEHKRCLHCAKNLNKCALCDGALS